MRVNEQSAAKVVQGTAEHAFQRPLTIGLGQQQTLRNPQDAFMHRLEAIKTYRDA